MTLWPRLPADEYPGGGGSQRLEYFAPASFFCRQVLVDSPVVKTPWNRLRSEQRHESLTKFEILSKDVYWDQEKLFDEKKTLLNSYDHVP